MYVAAPHLWNKLPFDISHTFSLYFQIPIKDTSTSTVVNYMSCAMSTVVECRNRNLLIDISLIDCLVSVFPHSVTLQVGYVYCSTVQCILRCIMAFYSGCQYITLTPVPGTVTALAISHHPQCAPVTVRLCYSETLLFHYSHGCGI